MASRIVLPAVIIVLALAYASGERIKCYECYSYGAADDQCNGDIMVKSDDHKPIECSTTALSAWYDKIRRVPNLMTISGIFNIANANSQEYSRIEVPMACMKMNLRVNNQPVILRTCQTAKTDQVDACNAITQKIEREYSMTAHVQNCTLCTTDSCNGSYNISPTMIVTLVPLLGSLVMSLVYKSA